MLLVMIQYHYCLKQIKEKFSTLISDSKTSQGPTSRKTKLRSRLNFTVHLSNRFLNLLSTYYRKLKLEKDSYQITKVTSSLARLLA